MKTLKTILIVKLILIVLITIIILMYHSSAHSPAYMQYERDLIQSGQLDPKNSYNFSNNK